MEEILMEQPYKVLVRMNDAGRMVAINSSAFVQDASGHALFLCPFAISLLLIRLYNPSNSEEPHQNLSLSG